MVDKITFLETLRSVQEIVKASTKPVPKEEILSYFEGMELSMEQQEMVWQYMQNPQEAFCKEGAGDGSASDSPEDYPHSRVFQRYLKELEGVPTIPQKQEEKLYGRLLAGDREAIADISRQWLGKVIEMAGPYVTQKALLEDLVQEGNLGLLVGMERLLGKGAAGAGSVRMELECSARKAMEDYRQQVEGAAHAENAILAKVNLLHKAQEVLAEENGTMPTFQELADYTNMPVGEIKGILSLPKEHR